MLFCIENILYNNQWLDLNSVKYCFWRYIFLSSLSLRSTFPILNFTMIIIILHVDIWILFIWLSLTNTSLWKVDRFYYLVCWFRPFRLLNLNLKLICYYDIFRNKIPREQIQVSIMYNLSVNYISIHVYNAF